jgi:integrase
MYSIVAVDLATGLRRGELLAPAWNSIDLDDATLRVERSLEQTKAGGLRFKPPKTQHGKRTISLLKVLREHRRQQLEIRLQMDLGKPEPDALGSETRRVRRCCNNLTGAGWTYACRGGCRR